MLLLIKIIFLYRQYSDRPPSVIVASTGLQLIKNRNTTEQVLEEYRRNLTQLVQPIDSLAGMIFLLFLNESIIKMYFGNCITKPVTTSLQTIVKIFVLINMLEPSLFLIFNNFY